MKNLQKRAITAFLFVGIILTAILLNKYAFVAIFGLICAGCLYEFHTLLFHGTLQKRYSRRIYGNVLLGLIPYFAIAFYSLDPAWVDYNRLFPLITIFFLFISMYYIVVLASKIEKPFLMISYALTGVFYVTIPCVLILFVSFKDGQYDYTAALGLLILTWINDTGAFLVGSAIGKRLLFERISPKKTWEGFWGGAILTILASYPIYLIFHLFPLRDWIVLAIIVVVFGTFGDLIESMFKRSFAAKDTGTILPGHGGLLDRFDSYLFLIPFAVFYILLVY